MRDSVPTEAELLERLRARGSEEERRRLLEAILTPYIDRIARWAMRVCSDPDEAAEVAQDALLSICSHIDQFRGESRFSTWIFTIVRNYGRRRGLEAARAMESPLTEGIEAQSAALSPEEAFDRGVRAEQFRRLISTELTPLEARIFMLHFAEEVPLAVLDRQLGLTNRSGARAYLVSAKRKLRRKMKLLEGPPRAGRRSGPGRVWTVKEAEDD